MKVSSENSLANKSPRPTDSQSRHGELATIIASAIQKTFQIKMAMINIAIQEDLPNVLALVTGSVEAFFLCKPNPWVRCSDTDDPRMVHCSLSNSREA